MKPNHTHFAKRWWIVLFCALPIVSAPSHAIRSTLLPPDSGYGSWGACSTITDSIAHPAWVANHVFLFSPSGMDNPPVLFFCHGVNATDPRTYMALLSFLTSNGYAVVYSPFASANAYGRPREAYEQLWKGIEKAVTTWSTRFDTSRIGFIGHSYGGGAVPSLAHRALLDKGWGAEAAFMFIMAPWYSYNINDSQLEEFPPHVTLIAQVYEDDSVNDHRMAKDIFETIAIAPHRKDFVVLFSDTLGETVLRANHGVPTGTLKFGPRVDLLDYYGVHRLVHALAEYSFTGDSTAQDIALGNGSSNQRFMGMGQEQDSVKPLYAGDTPLLVHPQIFYTNFWSHRMNPRAVMGHDSARIDHDMTIRNYMRSPWYKKMAEDQPRRMPVAEPDSLRPYQLICHVPPPDSGFGADGPYEPVQRFFPHPGKGDANVHIITPHGLDGRVPVVLFAPALWKPSPMFYRGLIDHIVSRGNIVVFSTYNFSRFFNHRLRYRVLLKGFDAGLELVAERIDTTRIAVVGHSYGGGAVPAVAWEYVKKRGWGTQGTALMVLSPWYMHNTSREMLQQFPPHAKLVVETFDGNRKMDWRIAEDLFYNIGIHPNEKDYIVISDAVNDSCEIDADHDAPQSEDRDEINVIDYYAIYRILDALMEYAFTSSEYAKAVALGNGSPQQVFMGHWRDGSQVRAMQVTDRPTCPYKQRSFVFEWDSRMNPRRKKYLPEK